MDNFPAFDTSPEGLSSLIESGESPIVEFKARLPPDEVVARNLIAFANGQGGILLVGVDDEGNPGTLRPSEVGHTISHLTRITESLLFQDTRVNATKIGPHWIAYIIVPPAPAHLRPLRTANGEVYERIGTLDLKAPEMSPSSMPCVSAAKCKMFIAMSFRIEEEPVLVDYFEAMKRAAEKSNLSLEILRLDYVEGDFEISQEIMNSIDLAQIVLADFTLNPRNVYFEAGYARAKKKRLIQTARKETALEFDVRNWKTIFYRNGKELETALIPALIAAYNDVASKGPG